MVNTLAQAVWRGDNGSVHYLSSSPEGSDLIFTSPAYGVAREHFDGPVRMVKSRAGHMYEMISATESTTVTPTTTGMLLHTIGGVCFYCTGPDADWSLPYGERHDYELWPHCPGDKRQVQPRFEREPEPAQSSSPSTGTPAESATREAASLRPSAKPSEDSQGGAKVRVFDPQYTPAPEAPVTPPELRWGPGPGASW
jgi:hypothetical protein